MKLITVQISAWIAIALVACAEGNMRGETQTSIASPAVQSAPQATIAQQPTTIQVKSVGPGDAPDEDALKQLVGSATQDATVQLVNYPDLLLSSRILHGFEAASRMLTTMDGQVINWGFKDQEANLQSVAISDAAGRLELVAVVDDVLDLVSVQGTVRFNSVADYQRAAKKDGAEPHVVLVVRDQAALKAAYPLFKSWMQANLLGFNTSCAKRAAACALMPSIEVRTEAYLSSGKDAAPVKTDVPNLPAAAIPLEAFTQ